jgi:hypothetical protein
VVWIIVVVSDSFQQLGSINFSEQDNQLKENRKRWR